MQPSHSEVEERINQIEAEMKRTGMWQEEPLRPEQLNFEGSFGGDTMAFQQWLQFVFLPRVRQIIAEREATRRMNRHTRFSLPARFFNTATLLCIGVTLSGCATAALTTLGTVAGAVGPAFSAGREVFSMGKLDTVEPADFPTALAATHRAAQQLGLGFKPLPSSAQSKDPTIFELRFYDDKCEKLTVRLDRHAAHIVRIRIDVGLFGSEPTARLFLAAIRANLPPFPSGTTRPIAVPQAPIETGGP